MSDNDLTALDDITAMLVFTTAGAYMVGVYAALWWVRLGSPGALFDVPTWAFPALAVLAVFVVLGVIGAAMDEYGDYIDELRSEPDRI